MHRLSQSAFWLIASLLLSASSVPALDLRVTELRCEYAQDPLGVDSPGPRLFWKLQSSTRGQRQTAYQILASSSVSQLARNKADLWDSGKVKSEESIQIPYAGKPLVSSQAVFWKVRVWDKDGRVSVWSEPASWVMGLLKPEDWQANWIGSGKTAAEDSQTLLLRRQFVVKSGLRRAVVHVCGLGCYELSLNGQKVGEDLFPPGWTKYDQTCQYDTYEVTAGLREGPNAVGLLLGNGMYNVRGGRYTKFTGSFGPLKAIAHLRLEYADGSTQIVGTDNSWRQTAAPITFSCVYGGEDYDARLESSDWNQPECDDSNWQPAAMVPGPGGQLKGLSIAAPPIRAFERLTSVQRQEPRPGVFVYDFGQNVSLIPRLTAKGPAGSVVRIIPAELLGKDGTVDRHSCGGGAAYWQYTLRGGGEESWFPKFFYHGSRYLQVERAAANSSADLPTVIALEARVVHSASEPVGEFECSNSLFNRVRTLVRWAQRSNMMSVMTDCPHREKLGWLEEDHLNGPSLRYEFNLARLFTKAMNDMADSQLENGLVPDIAPEYVKFSGGFRDSPEWGSSCVLVPWQQYEFLGDRELLRRHYESMQHYVAYLGSRATNHIVAHGLGDWYDIGPKPPGVAQLTPVPLTATAFYYYDAWILSQTAKLLGKTEDAREYSELAAQIRQAFNATFFDSKANRYASGSQCANAVALVMGLAEPSHRYEVLDNLVSDVQAHGNALTAGDVGYRYLLRALADGGRSDVIFRMNTQSSKPGYAYQLNQGATSLTEAWDAGRESSQNHFMLGQIMEWFYHDLAGIQCDPAGPGFKKVVIRPAVVGDITWAKTSYNSIRGPIVSHWRLDGQNLTLRVVIPPGATATIFVPAKSAAGVSESGRPLGKDRAVALLRFQDGCAVCAVGSGEYLFHSR